MATLSSIANRLSVFLPEMKFPLLNFHEPAFAYGPASRNLHCSPKLPPKHSWHIGISRYLFLRGQWRSLGGRARKILLRKDSNQFDFPHLKFESPREVAQVSRKFSRLTSLRSVRFRFRIPTVYLVEVGAVFSLLLSLSFLLKFSPSLGFVSWRATGWE